MARQKPDSDLAPDLRDVAWRPAWSLGLKRGTDYFEGEHLAPRALTPRANTDGTSLDIPQLTVRDEKNMEAPDSGRGC